MSSSIFARCSSLLLAVLLGGCVALPDRPVTTVDLATALESRLAAAERRGFAGQLLVMRGEEVLVKRGFGQIVPGQATALDETAVMPLASLTKPFTASAVLALAAAGWLGLDEPIGDFVSGLEEHWAEVPIHHYLTHTAGLPAEIVNRAWTGPVRFEPVGRDIFMDRLNQFQPDHPPGQGFNYSNIGYNLLAVLIETVAETDWETFLAGSLLNTADVSGIGLLRPGWTDDQLVVGRDGQRTSGHFLDQPMLDDGAGWHLRGAGDLLATPAGIAAWWQSIQRKTWLSQPWLALWLSPQVSDPYGGEYGYGWEFRESSMGPVIGHTGQELDFTSVLAWYQALETLVYINSANKRFRADRLLVE
ncbi:MAG: beta-lactamase family protein [Wenzhouxiangella sp.]|nr:beta-lactamase family protein [Wenzhouxiangella sp.]